MRPWFILPALLWLAPLIGSCWTGRVDHHGIPAARLTLIHFQALPATGPILPAGQVLLDLVSPRLATSVRVASGSVDAHVLQVPSDPALIGVVAASQALVLAPGGATLCNAFDLVVGCN